MFCPKCKSLMTPIPFGHFCRLCHEFVYKNGKFVTSEPRTVTASGVAVASVTVSWPQWVTLHSSLDFVSKPAAAFLLMEHDFPRHIWKSNVECRLQYSYAFFKLAQSWSQASPLGEPRNPALKSAEDLALIHLKRLIYGMDGARVQFDPRTEGTYLPEFLSSLGLIRSLLSRLAVNWLEPASCNVCGLLGEREELKVSKNGQGCSDCGGEWTPFRLDRSTLLQEMSKVKASRIFSRPRPS